MTDKRILFGKFEFPRVNGLEYLFDEQLPVTDYLFINEPNDGFSMYFEKDFPIFKVPDDKDREYCLFEMKRPNRIIKFFCPEKRKNLDSAVWYFYMEIFDDDGKTYSLPGQVRVGIESACILQANNKPKFIEVLEQVQLKNA